MATKSAPAPTHIDLIPIHTTDQYYIGVLTDSNNAGFCGCETCNKEFGEDPEPVVEARPHDKVRDAKAAAFVICMDCAMRDSIHLLNGLGREARRLCDKIAKEMPTCDISWGKREEAQSDMVFTHGGMELLLGIIAVYSYGLRASPELAEYIRTQQLGALPIAR